MFDARSIKVRQFFIIYYFSCLFWIIFTFQSSFDPGVWYIEMQKSTAKPWNRLIFLSNFYSYYMVIFSNMFSLGKYQIQSRKKEQFWDELELLWMWFFPIVPRRGRLADRYMGIVFFLFSENGEDLIVS